ncbi:unnamed protein product, partial [Symbiodinium microadriaticum]
QFYLGPIGPSFPGHTLAQVNRVLVQRFWTVPQCRCSETMSSDAKMEISEAAKSGDGTLANVGIKVNGKFKSPVNNQLFDTKEALDLHLKRFLPALRLHTARPRLLVFDSSGRLARHLQESLEDFEVVAVDDRTVPKRRSLGSLHEKAHFEVKADVLKTSPPALDAKAEAFDVVLVPFALHRLCWGEERLLLALW